MTKPNDFIMNSDYLSIAQIGSNTFDIIVPSGTLVVNGYTEQNFDFAVTPINGAIDRVYINKDGAGYLLGSYMNLTPVYSDNGNTYITGALRVFRTAPDNIRAQLVLQNYGQSTTSYPAMNFTIKVSSFRPPNVF